MNILKEIAGTRKGIEFVDGFCFNLILFDILFLPLFPLVSVSISLPIIFYWYLSRGKKTHFEKEYKYYGFALMIMVVSTMFNPIFPGPGETSFFTSIKRLFQYITSFWYFFFFEYYFIRYSQKIHGLVLWGLIFISLLAIVYLAYPEQFVNYKALINPADPHTRRFLQGELGGIYRYTFFWADANNVAYAVCGMMAFCVVEENNSVLKKYLSVVFSFFILLCTMSIGGIGVGATILIFLFVFTDAFRTKKSNVLVSLFIIAVIVSLIVYFYSDIDTFINKGFESRMDLYDDNKSGGRMEDFVSGLSKMSPLFLVIGSGHEGYVSEIGHIYIVGMYGMIVYVYFMYVLFAKRKFIPIKKYISIIPFFVGFTMNIAIIDQKFLLILLLISAYYSAESYKIRFQKHNLQVRKE